MPFNVPQQERTTLFHLRFLVLAPFAALVLIWWTFIPSAQRLAIELQHASTTLSRGLEKISTARGHNSAPPFAPSHWVKKNSFFPPWPLALRMHSILFVGWTVMAHLTKSHKTKSRRFATGLLPDKLHKQDFAGPLFSRALHHMKIVSRASRPWLLVGFLRILSNGLLQKDFTMKNMITPAVLAARMNLTLSLITMSVPKLYNIFMSFLRHATYCHKEIIFYTA